MPHTYSLLCELHWLRVLERISFRLCMLSSWWGTELPCWDHPPSFQLLYAPSSPVCQHVSSHRPIDPSLGDRVFPVAAARAWNSIPPSVRSAPSLTVFHRNSRLFCLGHHSLWTDMHVLASVLAVVQCRLICDCVTWHTIDMHVLASVLAVVQCRLICDCVTWHCKVILQHILW